MASKWVQASDTNRLGKGGLKDKDLNRYINTLENIPTDEGDIQVGASSRNLTSTAHLMKTFAVNKFNSKQDIDEYQGYRGKSNLVRDGLIFSEKKAGEYIKVQTVGRKLKKGVINTAQFPHLVPKPRQASVPAKKKGAGKEKSVIIKQGIPLNMTGGPKSLVLDTPIQDKSEKRTDSPLKRKFEEKRLQTQQDARKNTSLLATFKTPIKDEKEMMMMMTGLPSIRQEARRTRTNWVHQSEKVVIQKKCEPNYLVPHAPGKLLKG